jgi:hypothetical protein
MSVSDKRVIEKSSWRLIILSIQAAMTDILPEMLILPLILHA